jgi:hypothetical protein
MIRVTALHGGSVLATGIITGRAGGARGAWVPARATREAPENLRPPGTTTRPPM